MHFAQPLYIARIEGVHKNITNNHHRLNVSIRTLKIFVITIKIFNKIIASISHYYKTKFFFFITSWFIFLVILIAFKKLWFWSVFDPRWYHSFFLWVPVELLDEQISTIFLSQTFEIHFPISITIHWESCTNNFDLAGL